MGTPHVRTRAQGEAKGVGVEWVSGIDDVRSQCRGGSYTNAFAEGELKRCALKKAFDMFVASAIVHLRRGELKQSRSVMLRVKGDIRAAAAVPATLRPPQLVGEHGIPMARALERPYKEAALRVELLARGARRDHGAWIFMALFCIRVGMRESAFMHAHHELRLVHVWQRQRFYLRGRPYLCMLYHSNERSNAPFYQLSSKLERCRRCFMSHGRLRSSGLSDSSSTTTGRGDPSSLLPSSGRVASLKEPRRKRGNGIGIDTSRCLKVRSALKIHC